MLGPPRAGVHFGTTLEAEGHAPQSPLSCLRFSARCPFSPDCQRCQDWPLRLVLVTGEIGDSGLNFLNWHLNSSVEHGSGNFLDKLPGSFFHHDSRAVSS